MIGGVALGCWWLVISSRRKKKNKNKTDVLTYREWNRCKDVLRATETADRLELRHVCVYMCVRVEAHPDLKTVEAQTKHE